MDITSHKLYRDTKNFLLNELILIILISIFASFFTVIINHFISPNTDKFSLLIKNSSNYLSLFDYIKNMSNEQKFLLFRVSISSIFSTLIGNTILLLGIFNLIKIVSSKIYINLFNIFKNSIILFPQIFIQTFLITILIQVGFIVLIIPGIILTILLSLSPIIFFNKKTNIVDAIINSIILSWKNIKLITPAIIFWFILKILLILLFSIFGIIPNTITIVLLNSLSNIISSILIIYLYRLYILIS